MGKKLDTQYGHFVAQHPTEKLPAINWPNTLKALNWYNHNNEKFICGKRETLKKVRKHFNDDQDENPISNCLFAGTILDYVIIWG